MTQRFRTLVGATLAAAATAGVARAERLLGYSFVDQRLFKIDTDTGELIRSPFHVGINQLGGIDIDSQGNIYYLANNTLYRLDFHQPSNDVFLGSTPGFIFEAFVIVDDVGYAPETFTGDWYAVDLSDASLTLLGQYGIGGFDRITGLTATDYPGSTEATRVFGMRVFLDDIIEVDVADGSNLGTVLADPLLSATNLARGASGFWFYNQGDIWLASLNLNGIAVPIVEDVDVSGCDGITVVHPEPSIVTDALPAGTVGETYGPVPLEIDGGGPGIEWVALTDGYDEINTGENLWALIGQGQGLFGQDVVTTYALPFPFPFYGEVYTEVNICNNGFIDFAVPDVNPNNSDAGLILARRIAPLWDDLRTDFGGRDVFIDESQNGRVTIRWDTLQTANFGVCNFSCMLAADGTIEFHYGVPNENVTPTVGISAGDGLRFILAEYNGADDLGSASSLRFRAQEGLPPGLTLTSGGVVEGTPGEVGEFTSTIRLTDALGGFDERAYDVTIQAPCPADINGDAREPDGTVNTLDLLLLLSQWGAAGTADITGPGGPPDGVVDVLDLLALIAAWGDC